jgi:S-adenosylmethionine hydrolase
MKRIAPEAEILDITHGIERQQVLQGALVLANTLPYMPAGVHLAVVDPEVGSGRRAIAVRGPDRIFVGPDNGLLLAAADKLGGLEEAVELTSEEHRLTPVSPTFHGRDIFAPAAAHLSAGAALADLGPALDPASLERLELPAPEIGSGRIRVTVLYIDKYGNVQLNATTDDLARADIVPGAEIEVDVGYESYFASVARTFADVRAGEILLYEDSYRNVALAINGGSAAEMLSARSGTELRIRLR